MKVSFQTPLRPSSSNTQISHALAKRGATHSAAAFYEALEERGVDYVIRIPANRSLKLEIEDILFRPPGRPSRKPLVSYKSFRYQAESWSRARRVVAKVEHHQGELFPRVGFIVTSMSLPSRSVVRFYNKRGTAEQWIKEGKQATHWTRLSCHRFRAIDIGRPSRAFPVTPPGIRVPYHGGSEELSVRRCRQSRKAKRVEMGIGQRLLDSRMPRHGPQASRGAGGHCRSHVRHTQSP